MPIRASGEASAPMDDVSDATLVRDERGVYLAREAND
jgi:hypothetical protein